MNLQPLRTKSKEVPKLKERKRTKRNDQPLLGLYETKEMIQKQLMEDKTKIKTRNPKKQLISEEKWSQGTNWADLVREGQKREQESLIEEESKLQAEVVDVDKAMRIMVPGTKPITPTVHPSPDPAGFVKRSYGPREGGETFDVLLETATRIFDLVSKAGRNIASMATPITILVEKGVCKLDKLQNLGIKTQDI